MAFHTTAAVALLTIAVAQAFIVPEVVLMRVKRNPEPMRSFSFSGFNPNGQMAAFTGAAEYPMFSGYGAPPSQAAGPYYSGHPAAQDSYGPPVQDSYGPPPSGSAEQQQPQASYDKKQFGGQQPQQEYGSPKPAATPADSKEQNNNSVEQVDGGKKQYRGRDGPSSNAEASFNAWFPIMFGVFPNGANGNGNGQQPANRGNQGQAQEQGNSYGGNGSNGGFERLGGGTTVIANSVSNGKHGVATSHAIAYGNPRSSQK